MNTKTLYFVKRLALSALLALGLMFVLNADAAMAQKNLDKEVVTDEMFAYALNLKSLSDAAVYGESGVSDKGVSSTTNGFRTARADGSEVNRKDLANAFSAINQLPCRQIGDPDLSGKTFEPGVYCLAAADLANRLVLDGQNNSAAIFIFRVAGALNVQNGSAIALDNQAQSGNVYFVSGESATIGEGVNFRGNILAGGSITVGADAVVDGRVLSVKGDVALSGNSILGPQQTGVLEICQAVDASGGAGLENRFFRFQVGSMIVEVRAGQCSGPIVVPTGAILITELLTGRTIDGGNFDGNFQLTDVRQLSNAGQPNTTALVSANLPLRQAVVNVAPGDISTSGRLQFTNRFAIIAVVEICKEGIDSGVTGFFKFTIDNLRNGNTTGSSSSGELTTPAPLVQFTVPVGQCTGPIAVTAASDVNSGPPRTGIVTINQVPRAGFAGYIFTSATTALGTPAGGMQNINRLIGFNVLADGGGSATVTVVAGNDGGSGTNLSGSGGATSVQTTIFFNDRTAPGQLKICKIAGPGIQEFTQFTFEVVGVVPFNPSAVGTAIPVNTTPVLTSGLAGTQNPSQGITGSAGVSLQGGSVQNRTVTLLAGPPSNPGGFCQIVDRTFLVDTAVMIRETAPANATIANADGSPSGVAGQIRISRISSSTGILKTVTASQTSNFSGFGPAAIGTSYNGSFQPTLVPPVLSGSGIVQPNVNFFPSGAGTVTGVAVPIRRGITEVEFVSFAFSPVPLKICKVAGAGVAVGTPFTFTISTDTAGGLFAPFSSIITVAAGPAATNPGDQDGFCDFARGPFSPNVNNLPSFNFNSAVTVAEQARAGVEVSKIVSPTNSVIANLANRTAMMPNLINGVNEVHFTGRIINADATPPVIAPTIGGTLGNNNFYTGDASVSWSVSDSESSVSSKSGCDTTTVTTDTDGTTFTCSATSAGGTNSQSVTIKRDATAPTLSFSTASPAPNSAGWNNSDVSFTYTASDNLSGIAPSTPTGPLVIGTEGDVVTGVVTIIDNAGNRATFTTPAVKIDKTAPALVGLSNNSVDSNGEIAVNYSVSATDNLDSAPFTECSPVSGSIFHTGVTNVICHAADRAGNRAAAKTFQVYVLASGEEATPTGSNITVQSDTGTGLTFENVSAPGITTVDPIPDPATIGAVPGGFAVSNQVAFQIETTAAFAGSVRLAFVVPQNIILTPEQFNSLRILHGKKDAQGNPVLDADGNPVLEDVTEDNPPLKSTRDFNTRTIYAVTTSFSPFYLARQVNNRILPLFNQNAAYRSGGVIPIKLRVLDAAGAVNLSANNTNLTMRGLTLLDGNQSIPVRGVGKANSDNKFRFSSDTQEGNYYIYNLNTKGLAPGRYAVSFYVGNDVSFFYTVNFVIR